MDVDNGGSYHPFVACWKSMVLFLDNYLASGNLP